MADKHPFRVVIVGASVAGLSLANMLQANAIDFLVLEAYPTVAPQVGASIGLLPHGNRILDQLGLYEKVMEIAPPIQIFNFRDTNGQILARHPEMDERLVERSVCLRILSLLRLTLLLKAWIPNGLPRQTDAS